MFDSSDVRPTQLQILVRHSFFKGFVWYYRWHTIGESYMSINNERDLKNFINRVFEERNEMRKKRWLRKKMINNPITL